MPLLFRPSLNMEYSLVPQMVRNLPAMQETGAQSLGWEDPLKKAGNPLQHSCWEITWSENLEDYSPWSLKESDMTK